MNNDHSGNVIWINESQVHFIDWLDYRYYNDDRLWVETYHKVIALLDDDPELFYDHSWSELERLADGR